MKIFRIPFLMLLALTLTCKQNQTVEKPTKENKVILENLKSTIIPEVINELADFSGVELKAYEDIDTKFQAKQLKANGEFEIISMTEGGVLYKKMITSNNMKALPLFQIKNTDKIVLIVIGPGFASTIWGKILVDKKNLVIEKIQFEHKAESEGYGEQFTHPTFTDQFISIKINLESNSFGLNQGGKQILEGNRIIDGITGATYTSTAAVKMMNEGLQKYSNYLKQN